MAKLKNKTIIKVGDKMYCRYGYEYTIEELKVLSSEVIYIIARQKDAVQANAFVAHNNNLATWALSLSDLVPTVAYFDKKRAEEKMKADAISRRYEQLGYKLDDILHEFRRRII